MWSNRLELINKYTGLDKYSIKLKFWQFFMCIEGPLRRHQRDSYRNIFQMEHPIYFSKLWKTLAITSAKKLDSIMPFRFDTIIGMALIEPFRNICPTLYIDLPHYVGHVVFWKIKKWFLICDLCNSQISVVNYFY